MRPRIAPDGPEILLADIFGLAPELFYERNARSLTGIDYIAENSDPLTLGEITIDTPTVAAPSGFRWALKGEFTGQYVRLPDEEGAAGKLTAPLSILRPDESWTTLSATKSGSHINPARTSGVPAVGTFEAMALHCTRPLADLPDPAALTQTVSCRVGLTGAGSARFTSGAENETGGWDLTVRWVLEPTP